MTRYELTFALVVEAEGEDAEDATRRALAELGLEPGRRLGIPASLIAIRTRALSVEASAG